MTGTLTRVLTSMNASLEHVNLMLVQTLKLSLTETSPSSLSLSLSLSLQSPPPPAPARTEGGARKTTTRTTTSLHSSLPSPVHVCMLSTPVYVSTLSSFEIEKAFFRGVWEVCLELFCFVPICSSCSRERAPRLLQGRMVLAAFFPLFFRF